MDEAGDALEVDHDEATSTLTVTGELDDPGVAALVARLRERVEAGDVGLDLSGVTFLPSSAISALVEVRRDARERGHALRVSASEGTIAARILYLSAFPSD